MAMKYRDSDPVMPLVLFIYLFIHSFIHLRLYFAALASPLAPSAFLFPFFCSCSSDSTMVLVVP